MDIKPNSIEAIIYFALYICGQDKEISKIELIEMIESSKIVANLNTDDVDYFNSLDIDELVNNMTKEILSKRNWLGKVVFNDEKKYIHSILDVPNRIELALRVARIAASIDGLHERESHKFSFWLEEWNDTLKK